MSASHPTDRYLVRVEVDWEGNADVWWAAARLSSAPACFSPVLETDTDRITLSPGEFEDVRRWAESLPGWYCGLESGRTPLIYEPLCVYCLHPSGGERPVNFPAWGVYWDPTSRQPVAACDEHEPSGEYGSPTENVTAEEYAICEAAGELANLCNFTRLVHGGGQ